MDAEQYFWMIRRKDTKEWFRQSRGPRWAKQHNWVKERELGKAYGLLKNAQAGIRGQAEGNAFPVEFVRFRVVEDGVEEYKRSDK